MGGPPLFSLAEEAVEDTLTPGLLGHYPPPPHRVVVSHSDDLFKEEKRELRVPR